MVLYSVLMSICAVVISHTKLFSQVVAATAIGFIGLSAGLFVSVGVADIVGGISLACMFLILLMMCLDHKR